MKPMNLVINTHFRSAFAIAALVTLSWSLTASATLPPTNNLVLWLKPETLSLANGAGVTSWTDSSGNGNDAILYAAWSALPAKYYTNAINGRPAVGFGAPGAGGYGSDGNDALFISNRTAGTFLPISLPSGFTFATAFNTFNGGSNPNVLNGQPNFNNLFADAPTASQYGLMNGSPSIIRYDNAVSSSWKADTSYGNLASTNYYPGHFIIASHENNAGLFNDTITIMGDNLPSASTNVPYNGATDFRRVGQGPGGGGQAFDGLIGEFLVYSAPLSGPEQDQLAMYLTQRWLEIPEPTATAMLVLSGVLLLRKRRSTE